MKQPIYLKNNTSVPVAEIPVLAYEKFADTASALLAAPANHCVSYTALAQGNKLHFVCCIARDQQADIALFAHHHRTRKANELASLARHFPALQPWEREISENVGIAFKGHPWLKPLRFAHDRARPASTIATYPFYSVRSDELHEVGVGPIHAGIIEPGHFRFICHGERVLHLEIQLGYQHRGVESLMLRRKNRLQQTVLAESIAGDTTIGHTLAYAHCIEALAGFQPPKALELERTIALELERIAVHVGDLSALCTDVAYQLGSAVLGALRTPIINFMQSWCGNRFGKGLIRVGLTRFPLTPELKRRLLSTLDDFESRFAPMVEKVFSLPSLLHRFEKTGIVTTAQAAAIGAVGMAARSSGLSRDIRQSHPFGAFVSLPYEPAVLSGGDVYARALLRRQEIEKSIHLIRTLIELQGNKPEIERPPSAGAVEPGAGRFSVALVEGWRGEICHSAVTDEHGILQHYKVVDPSFHNWLALALAVRENEISDFPVCNKSFNLSYCGHDL